MKHVSSSPLLNALFKRSDETLHDAVKEHLAKGENPNFTTSHGETPLVQAFRRGRMDVFALLLDHGADLSRMRWGPLHEAVALSGMAEIRRVAEAEAGDMSARDVSGLTPFLLACDIGDIEKAAALLPLSEQEDLFATHHRRPALTVAAENGRAAMVSWLLANGFDVNAPDEFGGTALIAAAEADKAEVVKILLEAGADIGAKYDLSASVKDIDLSNLGVEPLPQDLMQDEDESFYTAASETGGVAVAHLLIGAGAQPHEFSNRVLRELTGAALIPKQQITSVKYEAQKNRRFGTRNPEPVAFEFWLEMVRTGKWGYWGHEAFGKGERDYTEPAIWSFDRFGVSTTELPDGVWVQVAGEHEDHYDPDFCIYNDVIVHDGDGNAQIYIYPAEIFPPTDFHTATLVDDAIILIGNLSYPEYREIGRTQALRLDLTDFSIHWVETSGEPPGWISSHKARLDGDRIAVWGGKVWTGDDLVPMDGVHELSLATGVWKKSDQA